MSQATLEPLGDRLTIERLPEETVSRGGVILPDQAQEKPHRGIVKHVGPLCGRELREGESPLAVGDEVLFSRYGGHEIEVDMVKLVLLREGDVFGRLRYAPEPAGAIDGNGEAMGEFGYAELSEENLRLAALQHPDDTELVVSPNLKELALQLISDQPGLTVRVENTDLESAWRLVQPAGKRGSD